MPETKLQKFLSIVRTADFRSGEVPRVWASEYHEALSSGLVSIHFGGSIRLSEAGHEAMATRNTSSGT